MYYTFGMLIYRRVIRLESPEPYREGRFKQSIANDGDPRRGRLYFERLLGRHSNACDNLPCTVPLGPHSTTESR